MLIVRFLRTSNKQAEFVTQREFAILVTLCTHFTKVSEKLLVQSQVVPLQCFSCVCSESNVVQGGVASSVSLPAGTGSCPAV